MTDRRRYIVTIHAGRLIASQLHGPAGSDIFLTPEEARYELLLRSISDPDDPTPPPAWPAIVEADIVLTFDITAVASFAANHGLPYRPSVVLTTPAGEVVDTDIFHWPGQVVLSFPSPFTGVLTLS